LRLSRSDDHILTSGACGQDYIAGPERKEFIDLQIGALKARVNPQYNVKKWRKLA
jgi:hypothetical protein